MQVREIMTQNPDVIDEATPIRDAAQIMRDINVGALPVSREDTVVGFLTDRDIVVRLLAENRNPEETTAGEIMTDKVYAVTEDSDLQQAVLAMEQMKVRRLLVTDANGEVVGILSTGDIATKAGIRLGGEVLGAVSEPSVPKR
jgi:CBS domain-containing protein